MMRLSDPNERAVIEDMLLESGRSLVRLCARRCSHGGDYGYGDGGVDDRGDGVCGGCGGVGDGGNDGFGDGGDSGGDGYNGFGDGSDIGGDGYGCVPVGLGGYGDGEAGFGDYIRIFKGFG